MIKKIIIISSILFIVLFLIALFFPTLGGVFPETASTGLLGLFILSITFLLLIKNFKTIGKGKITDLKTLFEVLAIIFASVYFFIEILGNLEVTSLELNAKSSRVTFNEADYLSVSIDLKKDGKTSMDIHYIEGYIYNAKTGELKDSISFNTKRFISNTYGKVDTIYSNLDNNANSKYTLASNEATTFSGFKEVEYGIPYRIEVVVIGRRTKFAHKVNPQFRASLVSLPVKSIRSGEKAL
ncbi:hypothetical protein [Rufibacter psychrotolerans]|uniref:hypothetical protein n=1 Tax=Rufibacter psychrotolerans TaxID=2812556 RepID=UPI001968689E|nr:hypothetical protein [Rufibacter sp. SYSU D00308]